MNTTEQYGYLESVMYNAPDAVYICDMQGRIVHSNRSAQEHLGYSLEQLNNMTIMDIDASCPSLADLQESWSHFKANETVKINGTHKRQDGSTFPVEIQTTTFTENNEKFILGFARDITSQKRAEQEWIKSEEKYKDLTNSVTDIYFAMDADLCYTFWNKACEDALGMKSDDVVGKSYFDLEVNKGFEWIGDKYKEAYVKQETILFEVPFELPESTIHYRVNCYPSKNSIVVYLQDITSEKKREEDLIKAIEIAEENEARFKIIADNVPGTIYICENDELFSMQYLNDRVEFLTGYAKEKFLKREISFVDLYHPDDKDRIFKTVEDALEKFEPFQILYRLKHKSGQWVWLQEYGTGVYKEGKLLFLEGFIIDVTEKKIAQERIEQSLEEKEVLIRELYHRTKNNMNVISSLLDLQSRYTDSSELKEIFDDTKSRILSMSLVHQMLYKSKDLSRINLKEYIQTLASTLVEGFGMKQKPIDFTFAGCDIWVLLDTATPCGLVINELLTNAFKHAFPDNRNGEVKIELTEGDSNEILIEYQDNGVGFPHEFDLKKNGKLGLTNIISLVQYQLRGKVSFMSKNGLNVSMSFEDKNYKQRI